MHVTNTFTNAFAPQIDVYMGNNMNLSDSLTRPCSALLAAACLLFCAKVMANESYCHSIQSTDKRNFCLAVAKGQQSYCHSVQESDTRNMCLALVTRQTSYCHSIGSSDSRNFCLGTSR